MRATPSIDLESAVGRSRSAATSPTCRQCGGVADEWLDVPADWRRPDAPGRFHVRRCAPCDVGFLDPLPSPDEIRDFYRTSYFTHDPVTPPTVQAGPTFLDRALMAVARRRDHAGEVDAQWFQRRFCEGPRAPRVCDVGCGNGVLLQRLAPLGVDMVGLEIDEAAAATARSLGHTIFAGSIESPPEALASRRFDVVCMMHVLEHCREPDEALHNAAALLDPSGSLVVEVPNNESLGLARAGATWLFLDVPRHLHFFTTRSLTRAVERAGLSVVEVEYVGYHRQFSRAWVEQEQAIWDRLHALAGDEAALPPRSTPARVRAHLASTLFAPASKTHDSVRVVCRRAG